MSRLICRLLLAGAALVPVAALTAQDGTVASGWHRGQIVVDGSMGDWSRLQRVGSGPAVAAENDRDTLLLVIASDDERVREQLATGLVVWIDATGRRRQTFGLRLEGLSPRPLPGAGGTAPADPMAETMQMTHESFDLLGPARLQRRLIDEPDAVGMRLATGVEHGMIVYEIKVPLRRSDATPHAVGAEAGGVVSVGLETPEPPNVRERRRLADPMNTNPWIYDPWGYGNYFRPPPPPGGGDRARREEPVKPMKLLWTNVRLAETGD